MKKMLVLVLIVCFFAASAYAKPPHAVKNTAPAATTAKPTAAERIGDEAADTVVDILVGEDEPKTTKTTKTVTSSKAKGTPPGLAKKGKTPPGWSKGNKKGWSETKVEEVEVTEKKESPVRRFIKGLFNKATSSDSK